MRVHSHRYCYLVHRTASLRHRTALVCLVLVAPSNGIVERMDSRHCQRMLLIPGSMESDLISRLLEFFEKKIALKISYGCSQDAEYCDNYGELHFCCFKLFLGAVKESSFISAGRSICNNWMSTVPNDQIPIICADFDPYLIESSACC